MDASTVFALLATAAVVWLFIRPSKSAQRERTAKAAERHNLAAPSSEAFHWPAFGEYEFEVVGESHYQQALRRFAGVHGKSSAEIEVVAELRPEDDNPHDPKAVAVRIQGETVGYLSREDARSFRRRLGQKGLGGAATTCGAQVVGGGTRGTGERLSYGVRLDIKPFE